MDTEINNTVQVAREWAVPPEPIEQEARRLVDGERQKGYSHPAENFGRIAKIWSGIIGAEVTPEHVAMCMVGVKLARECHEHNRDNLVDAIGYVLTLDMVNSGGRS